MPHQPLGLRYQERARTSHIRTACTLEEYRGFQRYATCKNEAPMLRPSVVASSLIPPMVIGLARVSEE